MLPAQAITYFNYLVTDAFCESAMRLSEAQRAFDHREAVGRGSGYAARLAQIYVEELQRRVAVVIQAVKDVLKRFEISLDADEQQHLIEISDKAVRSQLEGLKGAYVRHLAQFGLSAPSNSFDFEAAAQLAGLHNLIRRHLWTMENVPPMPKESSSQTMNLNFHAPVGAVQTGSHAVANVSQQWTQENVAGAIASLAQLRGALEQATGLDSALRTDLVKDIHDASTELQCDRPNTGRVARWLGGVGSAVQTISALQPAWEAAKAALRAIGINL